MIPAINNFAHVHKVQERVLTGTHFFPSLEWKKGFSAPGDTFIGEAP